MNCAVDISEKMISSDIQDMADGSQYPGVTKRLPMLEDAHTRHLQECVGDPSKLGGDVDASTYLRMHMHDTWKVRWELEGYMMHYVHPVIAVL